MRSAYVNVVLEIISAVCLSGNLPADCYRGSISCGAADLHYLEAAGCSLSNIETHVVGIFFTLNHGNKDILFIFCHWEHVLLIILTAFFMGCHSIFWHWASRCCEKAAWDVSEVDFCRYSPSVAMSKNRVTRQFINLYLFPIFDFSLAFSVSFRFQSKHIFAAYLMLHLGLSKIIDVFQFHVVENFCFFLSPSRPELQTITSTDLQFNFEVLSANFFRRKSIKKKSF